MSASTKLHQLESKISELQKQHQLLLKERQQEIAALISMVDLAQLDDKTLMGGLLFLKEKITTQNPMMETWHTAGEKFLRQYKLRTSSFPQSQAGEKKAGR